MLIGRDDEMALLRTLLADADGGRARGLALRGEAGIGKTTLLTEFRRFAEGCRPAPTILRMEGHEVESHVAFAGLSTLLTPLLPILPSLLEVQRSTLAGVLRLERPEEPQISDRLSVGTATLNLLSAAAESGPVLVLVDDAHWLDLPSLEAITFAARRMRAERLAVVLASRTVDDVDPPTERWLSSLPQVHLPGLSEAAVARVLADHDVHVEPELLRRHVIETAGNPLALVHLAGHPMALSPVEPLPIGRQLELAFSRRLRPCSQSTRSALLLLAVCGTEPAVLARALEQDGRSIGDLEAAEIAGLISVDDGTFRFVHPLVRAAVYQLATPAERRAAHRTMAAAIVASGTAWATEREALHLAAATALPDAAVADRVDAAAVAALARRNFATAMNLYETAARLSPAAFERVRRWLAAADLCQAAGRIGAGLEILRAVREETDSPELLSQAVHLRCRIEMWAGRPVDARDTLLAESVGIAAQQPVWKAIMLSHAALLTVTLGEQTGAVATATAAVDLVVDLPDALIMPALVVQALTLATDGQVPPAAALMARCEEHLRTFDPLASEQVLLVAALAEDSMERSEPAMRWYLRATGAARDAGAAGLLPFQLNWMAMAHWRRGDWALALSTAAEAVDLAEEAGWSTELPNCLVGLALVEAGLGRAEDARAHARRAVEIARPHGTPIVEVRAGVALALLDLGTGDFGSAARRLRHTARFAAAGGLGDPVLLPWAADALEAGIRAGDDELVQEAAGVLAHEAQRSGRPTARARAARARALLADDPAEAARAIGEALEQHARARWPFEEARTRLVQGELLRRARRPARARESLADAAEMFGRLGAAAFTRRATAELRAAGGPHREPEGHTTQLTPQEVHVALVVAEGATNGEAASRLFLSPKTIEYHLSNIYRKAGVRSRGQLARAVADGRILGGTDGADLDRADTERADAERADPVRTRSPLTPTP